MFGEWRVNCGQGSYCNSSVIVLIIPEWLFKWVWLSSHGEHCSIVEMHSQSTALYIAMSLAIVKTLNLWRKCLQMAPYPKWRQSSNCPGVSWTKEPRNLPNSSRCVHFAVDSGFLDSQASPQDKESPCPYPAFCPQPPPCIHPLYFGPNPELLLLFPFLLPWNSDALSSAVVEC